MEIEIEFFGPIKRPWVEHRRRIQVAQGSCVASVMGELGYDIEQLRMVALTINGQKVSPGHVLMDNDELTVVLLAGGG